MGLNLGDCTIIDPSRSPEITNRYGQIYYEKRARKGITLLEATRKMRQRTYFGTMMVELGEADAFISGQNRNYPDTIRPALEIIGKEEGTNKVAGMYIIMSKQGPLFFADTTVNSVTVGTNAAGARTISTSAPSGGSSGDVWYRVRIGNRSIRLKLDTMWV